mmetsp:Transcript_17731/g.53183  ORF Transcript_17731/g.53183 Transcript_17731/m.53183 type:complete len:429 (-) Transcript_17731:1118-2404(-)
MSTTLEGWSSSPSPSSDASSPSSTSDALSPQSSSPGCASLPSITTTSTEGRSGTSKPRAALSSHSSPSFLNPTSDSDSSDAMASISSEEIGPSFLSAESDPIVVQRSKQLGNLGPPGSPLNQPSPAPSLQLVIGTPTYSQPTAGRPLVSVSTGETSDTFAQSRRMPTSAPTTPHSSALMSPGHGPLLSPTLTAATLPSLLRSAFAEPPRSPGAAPLPYSRSLSVRTSMSPPHSPHDSDNEEPPSPLAAAHGQQFMLPHAATFVRFLDQDTQSGSAQQRKKQYRNSADAAALMQDLHRMHLVPPLGASGAERHSVSVPASPMISATTSLSLGASPISKGLTSPQMVPAQVPASPSRLSAYGVAMSSESGENLLPIAAMSSLHSSSVSSSSSSSSSSSPSSSSSSSYSYYYWCYWCYYWCHYCDCFSGGD